MTDSVIVKIKGTVVPIVTNLSWSGSIDTCSRELTCDAYSGDYRVGDKIELFIDDKRVYLGMIFNVGYDVGSNMSSIMSYDYGIWLLKTSLYYAGDKAGEFIIQDVFNQTKTVEGVPVKLKFEGDKPTSKIKIIDFDKTPYDIVSHVLAKWECRHSLIVDGDGVAVITDGRTIGEPKTLQRSLMFNQTIEDVVNRIKSYKELDDGTQVELASLGKIDNESIAKFGLFGAVQTVQDHEGKEIGATLKELQPEPTTSASATYSGDVSYISGRSITIDGDEWLIMSDTHNFSDGDYYVEMQLRTCGDNGLYRKLWRNVI